MRIVVPTLLALLVACPSKDAEDDDGPTDTDTDTDGVGDTDDSDSDADTDVDADLPPYARWSAGERLTPRVWTDGAGAEVFADFWDEELEVACAPRLASDGSLRCLPRGGDLQERFRDSECTDPVFLLEADACDPTAWVTLETEVTDVCGFESSWTVFEPTEVGPVSPVYLETTLCRAAPQPGMGALWFEVDTLADAPRPPADFVAFQTEDREIDGLGVRSLVGEDGSRLGWSLIDESGPCSPEALGNGFRCISDRRGQIQVNSTFGSSNCTTDPVAVVRFSPSCGDPAIVVERDGQQRITSLYEPGPAWTDPVYGRQGPQCRLFTGEASWIALGDVVSPTELPAVEESLEGTADLRAVWWSPPGGSPVLAAAEGTFRDAAGAPCVLEPTATGGRVCVPESAEEIFGGVTYFADDACTDAVVQLGSTIPAGTTSAVTRGTLDCSSDDAPFGVTGVWTIGDTYSGDLWIQQGASCAPNLSTGVFGGTWKRTEFVAPESAYPSLSRVARP